MREFTSPALVTLPDDATLTDGLFDLVERRPEQVVIRRKVDDGFVDVTYREFFDLVLAAAGGLVARGV
ncbi:long-chain fatty acid--CoA ligase, partial [Frankia sp. CN4]|nr:long-chain fatty acid--CoA ligase [Frankia nepalensis]